MARKKRKADPAPSSSAAATATAAAAATATAAAAATNRKQELPSSELKACGTGTIYVHITDDRQKRNPKVAAAEEDDGDEFTKLLEPLSREHLVYLLRKAAEASPATMAAVQRAAEFDPATRKLFVHGLRWGAGADALRAAFSRFGELEDCRVVTDKNSGKSKGYGFVLFRSRDGALRALRRPHLQIRGRLAYYHLAASGPTPPSQNPPSPSADASSGTPQNAPASSLSSQPEQRKIFIGNVHADVDVDRLHEYFSQFGEIEQGPLMGFDKSTGEPTGFALFVYKSTESARRALEEPMQNFDGKVLSVQATDGITKSTPGSNSNANSNATAASTQTTEPSISAINPYDPSTDGATVVHGMGFAQQAAMLGMGTQQQAFAQPNFAMLAMMAAAMQNPAVLAALNQTFAAMGAGGQHTGVPGSAAQGFGTQGFAAGGADYSTAAGLQGVAAYQRSPPGFQGTPGFPTSAGFQVGQAASQTGTAAAAAGATAGRQGVEAYQGGLPGFQGTPGFRASAGFQIGQAASQTGTAAAAAGATAGLQRVAAYQGGPPGFQGMPGFPASAGFQIGQAALQTGTTAADAGATAGLQGVAAYQRGPPCFQGTPGFLTSAGFHVGQAASQTGTTAAAAGATAGLQGVAAYQGGPPGSQGMPGFLTSVGFQVGQAASQTGTTAAAAGATGYQAGASGQGQVPSSQTGFQVGQAASQTGTAAAAAGATAGLQGVEAYQGGLPGFQGTPGFPTSAGFQVSQAAFQTGTTTAAAGATGYQAGAVGQGQLPSSQGGY